MHLLNSTKHTIAQRNELQGELLDEFERFSVPRTENQYKSHMQVRQSLLYVAQGYAELGMFNQGANKELVVRRVDNAFLNPTAFLSKEDSGGYWFNASFSRDSTIFHIDLKAHRVLTANSRIYNKALQASVHSQFIEMERKCFELSHFSVKERVLSALKSVASCETSITHPEGIQIAATRSDIASYCGCSREMVGRVLVELESSGDAYGIPESNKLVVTHKALDQSRGAA